MASAETCKLIVEMLDYHIKLGFEYSGMLFHMSKYTVNILKELNVAVLIHLIIADSLSIKTLFDSFDIVIACRKSGNTRAGESDLGG